MTPFRRGLDQLLSHSASYTECRGQFRVVLQQSRSYADDALVAYHSRSAGCKHAVSPELALVDPVLAEWARSQLGDSDNTLDRLQVLVDASRRTSLANRATETRLRRFPNLSESRERVSRRQGRFAVFAGGFALAGVFAVAMLLAVHAYVRGTPAGADMAAIDELLVQSVPRTNAEDETFTRPRADQTTAVTKPAPQRFAWAPSPGATAYHFELFRGSTKVFDADTQHTVITIPVRWTFDGRMQALEPGEYRWYVWPLVAGIRAARAIVQARLSFQGMNR